MDYDLTIIGAGWAGFNAAVRAKALGLKVCLIDKGKIGGTCLNRGCIPTKTLIQSAKVYSLAKKSKNFGVETQTPRINFSEIQARKNKIVQQLNQGMQFLLKDVDFLNEEAAILSPNRVGAGAQEFNTKFILIATGSRPMELGGFKFDGKKIISSDEILELTEVPRSLLIIGGGVIGCEFASLFSTLGTEVTVVEKMPQLLPGEDKEIAKKIEIIFKKKGIKVNTGTDALSLDLNKQELVLLSIGRVPDAGSLGIEKIGVALERGRIIVDEELRTSVPNIYAAGDCTGKIMLAHFAAYQGRIASENIAHPEAARKADNNYIPACIFTDPEIAGVGLNEDSAAKAGIEVKAHKFDFLGSGMARILDESEGFIKIISESKTGEVVGASIIGPKATELIAVLGLAVSNRLTVAQMRKTVFAHPTLAEAIGEALEG